MKISRWQIFLAVLLVGLSALLYGLHFLLFHDAHHIFIYLLGDIAFLPIEVLLVTVVLHELLTVREKRSRRQKLNMVIGAFFSELGTRLLILFSNADPRLDEIKGQLLVSGQWTDREFARVRTLLRRHQYAVDLPQIDLPALRQLLDQKEEFILRLFENPSLLEHETFTDLLWAVSHVDEELDARKELAHLTAPDAAHLAGDIKRAYGHLAVQWLDYMAHLKEHYPYLFSLAMRTNPFDENAVAEVQ
ncbi:MAG: hypothetical protein MUC35_05725 [Candidatus Margulisbacteria bacterium]|jgi:hypothetical protein|nr:hypothetical protein [Candidatus Margulisiibacteriota bacterium]